MIDKLNEKLKAAHIVLAVLIIVLFQIFSPIVSGFVDKSKIENKIQSHEERINKLEYESPSNKELLQEIKFNLKNYMNQTGHTYIENTNAGKK